jgi:transposase-like protein
MEGRNAAFRRRAQGAGLGVAGRRYPVELRREAVALARLQPGQALSRVAQGLGVDPRSLRGWMATEEVSRFRPVEVEPSRESLREGLVLVTPRGYRIEGLSVEQLSDLLRELS